MGGSGRNDRASSAASTGRSSIVHDLALAERLTARAEDAGTRTARMDVRDVMNLLVAEQQIARESEDPGRSGTRPAMRQGADGPSVDAAPIVPVAREPEMSVEFEWISTSLDAEQAPAPAARRPHEPAGSAAPAAVPDRRRVPTEERSPSLRPVQRRSAFRRLLAATLFVAVMSGAFYLLVEASRRAGLWPEEQVRALLEWGRAVIRRL